MTRTTRAAAYIAMPLSHPLHAILLLMSIASCALTGGCIRHPEAERQIFRHGGEIVPDYTLVDFSGNEDLSDEDIASLSWALRTIRPVRLDLGGTAITDRALTDLARIKGMRALLMGGTKITPAGLDRLLRIAPKSLRSVGLPDEWIVDPVRAAEVKAIEQRYPDINFSFWYRDANGARWRIRKGEGASRVS